MQRVFEERTNQLDVDTSSDFLPYQRGSVFATQTVFQCINSTQKIVTRKMVKLIFQPFVKMSKLFSCRAGLPKFRCMSTSSALPLDQQVLCRFFMKEEIPKVWKSLTRFAQRMGSISTQRKVKIYQRLRERVFHDTTGNSNNTFDVKIFKLQMLRNDLAKNGKVFIPEAILRNERCLGYLRFFPKIQ